MAGIRPLYRAHITEMVLLRSRSRHAFFCGNYCYETKDWPGVQEHWAAALLPLPDGAEEVELVIADVLARRIRQHAGRDHPRRTALPRMPASHRPPAWLLPVQ